MVEYSDHRAIEPAKNSFNEYWKLPFYWLDWGEWLRAGLRRANRKVPSSASKGYLVYLVGRCEHGLISYNNCSVKELQTFCIQRGLGLPPTPKPKKQEFVDILEDADDVATFPHFLDLPPELRVRIYNLHFNSLPALDNPAQPPISKTCRSIREESLPIFYQTCTFILNMEMIRDGWVYGWHKSSNTKEVQKAKGDFFRNTSEEHTRMIRHLFIHCRYKPLVRGSIHFFPRKKSVTFRLEKLEPPELATRMARHLRGIRARPQGKHLTRRDIKTLKNLIQTYGTQDS